MQWSSIAAHGVLYGLAVSVLFTLALLAGFLAGRDFLVDAYPPAIRERYARPKSARGRRVALHFGVIFWGACFLPLLVVALLDLRATTGGDLGFLPAAACAAIVSATMSAYDLVVIDWLVFAGLRPRLMTLPGTEGMKEYRDLRFHLVQGLKGSPLILVVGLAAGGAVAAVEALT
ncbi:hypothetical protein [Streptosporangium minutum]|uniref:Nitroreductase n=1 Tax=Streptosporangium minutum TaxID=569862 RepID=A0A243RAG4_9ACTN|nr:hypothetical protein [Streptosporangium minutum]OUC91600.1 hypothetical protein CA984_33095 [Streptosporangium minutum]